MNLKLKGQARTVMQGFGWLLLIFLSGVPSTYAGVATTKHNLSVSGTGTVKASSEPEVCVFCHAPHNASPSGALWNRSAGATTYTPYTSSTKKSVIGQPNGSSLLCLSCHDGTIALGKTLSRGAATIAMNGVAATTGTLLAGNSNLGTDLSNDHPVSFVYDAALVTARGELNSPATLVKPNGVRLDSGNRVQCTSCHDPHDDTNGKFLVVKNTSSALCVTCHSKSGWASSDHKNSTKTWNGIGTSPWPHTTETTVAANACENCHRPHTAGGGPRLLNYAAEETNCSNCHNGNAAAKNVQADFNKISVHGVASYTGVHDPSEAGEVTSKHVECVDCHNPHQAAGPASTNAAGSNPATIAAPLAGVRGVTIGGAPIASAQREEEICFRCHGGTSTSAVITPRVTRQIATTPVGNERLKFLTTNPSFHSVAGARTAATTVPSLIAPWAASSTMKCTHCHNSDTAATVGTGTGPNGPHGSVNAPILAKAYSYADSGSNSSYNANNFALCYSCHSSATVYSNNTSSFRYHQFHLDLGASCSTCHDPHGVPAAGTTTNNSRLINFNTSVVTASGGILRHVKGTGTTGSCQLVCHGKNHNPFTY